MTDYAPIELYVPAISACYETGMRIERDYSYRLYVRGTWVDFIDDPVNANGNPTPGGVRRWMGWAKRSQDLPWMALLVRSRSKNSVSPWQWVRDGDNLFTNLPEGTLELCANDVIGFYWNNSDALLVEVTGKPRK